MDTIHVFRWKHTGAITLLCAFTALVLNSVFTAWDHAFFPDEFTALAIAKLGVLLPVGLGVLLLLYKRGQRLEIADQQFLMLWFYLLGLGCFLYAHVRISTEYGPRGLDMSLVLLCAGVLFYGLRPMTAIVFCGIVMLGTFLVHVNVHEFQWIVLQLGSMVFTSIIGILGTAINEEVLRDHYYLLRQEHILLQKVKSVDTNRNMLSDPVSVSSVGALQSVSSGVPSLEEDKIHMENAYLRRRMLVTLKYQKHLYIVQVVSFATISAIQWWEGFIPMNRVVTMLAVLLPVDILALAHWWISVNNWLADELGSVDQRVTRSPNTITRENFPPGAQGDKEMATYNANAIRTLLLRKPIISLCIAIAYVTLLIAWPPDTPKGTDNGVPYVGVALVLMLSMTSVMQVANHVYVLVAWSILSIFFVGMWISGFLRYSSDQQSLADAISLFVGISVVVVPSIILERLDRKLFYAVYKRTPIVVGQYDKQWLERTRRFWKPNPAILSLDRSGEVATIVSVSNSRKATQSSSRLTSRVVVAVDAMPPEPTPVSQSTATVHGEESRLSNVRPKPLSHTESLRIFSSVDTRVEPVLSPSRPTREIIVLVISSLLLGSLFLYTFFTHMLAPSRITTWSPFWSNLAYLPLYALFIVRDEPLLATMITPTIIVSFFYHMSDAYGEAPLVTPIGIVTYEEWQVSDMVTATYAVYMGLVYFAARGDSVMFGGASAIGFFVAALSIVALNQVGSVIVIIVAATVFLHELIRMSVGAEEARIDMASTHAISTFDMSQVLPIKSTSLIVPAPTTMMPPAPNQGTIEDRANLRDTSTVDAPIRSQSRDIFTLRQYSPTWLLFSAVFITIAMVSWVWGINGRDRDSIHSYWHIFGGAAGFFLVYARMEVR